MKFIFIGVGISLVLFSCSDDPSGTEKGRWENHGDSASYVGGEQCRACHADKFEHFSMTGMGLSMDSATKQKSSADFSKALVHDTHSDLWYRMYWEQERMMMEEFRLEGHDTVHSRKQWIHYVIGSGQHTNSHLFSVNGYMYQAPMTYYTQEGKWDLPPGYENGHNTRFSRKIGVECLTCHNSLPDHVHGSENKYTKVPNGISCERCHGPGSLHVKRKLAGEVIDTSLIADRSIVNPGRLEPELQFDLCQRCHLQGNAVLSPGKSFFDFRPGMKLSDHMTVFLPRYKDGEEDFIMASHADRLKMSACYSGSKSLTCVTCHDPHVSVKRTDKQVFNKACMSCHASSNSCSLNEKKRELKNNNCVSCHMPRSGSIDIPHVTVTDHFIRKRPSVDVQAKKELKAFLGLYAVNNPAPTDAQRAEAYMNQYEKFEQAPYYLDSAFRFLERIPGEEGFDLRVRYYFIKKDHEGMIQWMKNRMLQFSNGWTAYRVGESFFALNNPARALLCYREAVRLMPYQLEFRNKLAVVYMTLGKRKEAEEEITFIMKEDPNISSAWSNLGVLFLSEGKYSDAESCFKSALQLDPDYETGMNNMLRLYYAKGDKVRFSQWLEKNKKKFPNSTFVKQMQGAFK